ncbi:MAG: fatty acid desaturase [Archangiaceae bacterium]|nr:fatty acid desaturase [Archangiaceae bacterium]
MTDNFLKRVLQPPAYGWSRNDAFYAPTFRELLSHWLSQMNLLRTRKNWLAVTGWVWTLGLVPFAVLFLTRYFSWRLAGVGFLYAMVGLGTVNIVWLHRYCTHRAFTFSHPFYRFVVRNLTLRLVPEETYVVSHHVHHAFPEQAGDPYNVHGGRLYCLFAAELHQGIARDLSPADYARTVGLVSHTGVVANSYAQYQRWGSICHPALTYLHLGLNWAFWYGAFFLIGGHGLACAIFGMSSIWAIGIRDFNYDAHGAGKDRRRVGVDFNRKDLSINQLFAGTVSGEWHNNHHLFPTGARSGFLWWQLDTAWWLIQLLRLLGGISSYRDFKERFLELHYRPYRAQVAALALASEERRGES